MAGSGIKNTLQLTTGNLNTYSLLYTVPAGYYGIYNISFTNTSATSATIRLYIGASTTSSIVTSEAFEFSTTVIGNGVFERTGLAIQAGANFVISSSGSAMNVNIYGIETATT